MDTMNRDMAVIFGTIGWTLIVVVVIGFTVHLYLEIKD